MTEKKPTLEYEPRSAPVKRSPLRYVAAGIFAAGAFMGTLALIAVVFGMAFDGIPARWAVVPILGQLATAGGAAIYTFRYVVKAERGE